MGTVEYYMSGGLRLACERAGSGPVVVFLHGIGGNRCNWKDQLEAFSDRFTTVAWDARGYGDSDDPVTPLRFSDFADDLKNLLDYLGASKAHLVGLSMGGMILQDFYSRYPTYVHTLTLVNSSSGFGILSAEAQASFLEKRLTPLEQGETLQEIAPQMVDILVAETATPEARAKIRRSLDELRAAPYKQTLRAIVETDFRKILPAIRVPTLVIVGAEDRVLPPPASEALAAAIEGAEYVILPGVGHLSNIEKPDEFNHILSSFLISHG